MSSTPSKLGKIIIISLSALWLSGCIIHVGGKKNVDSDFDDVSSVFGGVDVSDDRRVGDLSSVNGGIELGNNVTAETVDTVNGSIEIGANVTVDNASTVNGDIEAQGGFKSFGNVSTVNGDVAIKQDSEVQGDIETINGDVELKGVLVSKDVSSKNGDISLTNNTIVYGDLVYQSQDKSGNKSYRLNRPELKIESGSQVLGDIILYRQVELEIDDPELLDKVQHLYSQK